MAIHSWQPPRRQSKRFCRVTGRAWKSRTMVSFVGGWGWGFGGISRWQSSIVTIEQQVKLLRIK